MKKIAVLISGRGSNLQAIIDAKLPVAVVISNDPSAFGLERAKKHNIPAVVINHKDYKDKNIYELEIVKVLQQHKVDLVCLASYMRIVGKVLLDHYLNKILNIHSAVLPSFPGLHSKN